SARGREGDREAHDELAIDEQAVIASVDLDPERVIPGMERWGNTANLVRVPDQLGPPGELYMPPITPVAVLAGEKTPGWSALRTTTAKPEKAAYVGCPTASICACTAKLVR